MTIFRVIELCPVVTERVLRALVGEREGEPVRISGSGIFKQIGISTLWRQIVWLVKMGLVEMEKTW